MACAHRPPASFAQDRAAAERAYASGRYTEAAERWLSAAEHAAEARDAHEARYRAAASYARAGDLPAAESIYAALERESEGERSARAAFERAELARDQGDDEAARALLDAALRAHPEAGVARRALERELGRRAAKGGPEAALAYIATLEGPLGRTSLAEPLLFARGRYAERAGHTRAARDAYLELARRFPYPYGLYWDDALYYAALLEVRLGTPARAVEHLEAMLAEREPEPRHGTRERPKFPRGRLLLATVLRDELGDIDGARREFLRLATEHHASTLRDDALWEVARIDAARHDPRRTCDTLRKLLRELPDSRYGRCAHLLCPELPPLSQPCPSYVDPHLVLTSPRPTRN